jgi:hypothetical protein
MPSHKKTFLRFFLLVCSVAGLYGQGLTLTPQTLPNETVGAYTPVDFTPDISGGTSPYSLTLVSGAFPPGQTIVGPGSPQLTGFLRVNVE